jgi:hypothetical protein
MKVVEDMYTKFWLGNFKEETKRRGVVVFGKFPDLISSCKQVFLQSLQINTGIVTENRPGQIISKLLLIYYS